MTDIDTTRLCAEAMGYKDFRALPDGHFTGRNLRYEVLGEHGWALYDPLQYDAQAMALAKRFMMEVDFFAGAASIKKPGASGWGYIAFSDDSINRAIVECVAKMQAEKQPPYVGERSK